MKIIRRLTQPMLALVTAVVITLSAPMQRSVAAPLDLAQIPLPLLTSVAPNIIFTVDDSGSMSWGYMPDALGTTVDSTRRGCASNINRAYYDPSITYDPGVDSNGVSLGNSSFTAAWDNGFNQGGGSTNLSTSFRVLWNPIGGGFGPNFATCADASNAGRAAFYYVYDTTCGNPNSDTCYNRVTVSATSGPGASDERQNFANWYSYYRTRVLLAKTAAGRAFARVGTDVRLAYQRLNTCASTLGGDTSNASCPGNYVKPFSGANRTSFFSWLYASGANGGTPLVPAFHRAGQYLSRTDQYSPWAETPGTSVGAEHSCRQNFHVAFTDGLWNSGSGITGNRDNPASALTLPTHADVSLYNPGTYSPGSLPSNRQIYPDTNSDFLADNAFYYWSRDARTDLTNNVPQHVTDTTGSNLENFWNPRNDPATWQHLVNFTVGMGIAGNRAFDADYNGLLNGTITWGNNHVDDLWHAAVNSRGQYFNASNATTLADSLSNIINDIGARSGSAAGLAANSSSLTTNTQIFQVRFQTGGWAGQLFSFGVNPTTGAINPTPTWDAAEKLRTQNWDTGRTILTFDPSTNQGKSFRWADLNTTQQGLLNTSPVTLLNDSQGVARLEYLRGRSQHEGTGNNYRQRVCYSGSTVVTCPGNTGWLGDITHSAPIYIGPPPFFYPDNLESGTNAAYSTFRSTHQSRKPMLYVGANDGMMHGIDVSTVAADQGKEVLAYVPNEVMPQLNRLTSASSAHRFYVDGTPAAGDVYITPRGASEPEWRTVLVGGLRNGGKAYYALDITDPSSFSEAASAPNSTVLWEFTDADLGFTHSTPTITKMANGKWAAIFGNGYNNSGTGTAVLYIVFIEDGIDGWSSTEFVKIDTGVGSPGTPNGLATPAAIDIDQNFRTDYIYAGDLQGNMWRFNVSSTNPADWSSVSNRLNLFTAQTSGGVAQPITTRPSVARHPAGEGGLVLYFGTGKFLEPVDNTTSGIPTQTLYAVWDKLNTTTVARSDLLTQTLTTDTAAGVTVRVISDNPITWRTSVPGTAEHMGWLVDMPSNGERIIAENLLLPGRVVVASYIPTDQACTPGGTGWLMQFDLVNGGRLDSTFDVDGDGSLGASDTANIGGVNVAATGIQVTGGGLGSPIVLAGPVTGASQPPGSGTFDCQQNMCQATSTGQIVCTKVPCSTTAWRESWQQLK
jgi:type IV pilus assembly protein PilY1